MVGEYIKVNGRKLYKVRCHVCGEDCFKRPGDIKRYRSTCSPECLKKMKENSKVTQCSYCQKKVKKPVSQIKKSKSGLVFCNRSCSASYNNKITKYKGGFSSYRDKALNTYKNACIVCGYDKSIKVLEVHHVDHDRDNNKVANLEILCPTCHKEKHVEIFEAAA